MCVCVPVYETCIILLCELLTDSFVDFNMYRWPFCLTDLFKHLSCMCVHNAYAIVI